MTDHASCSPPFLLIQGPDADVVMCSTAALPDLQDTRTTVHNRASVTAWLGILSETWREGRLFQQAPNSPKSPLYVRRSDSGCLTAAVLCYCVECSAFHFCNLVQRGGEGGGGRSLSVFFWLFIFVCGAVKLVQHLPVSHILIWVLM